MTPTAGFSESPKASHTSAVIFDWAGTVLDFGCIAPMEAFREAFLECGLEITEAEVRGPMGAGKREHIGIILAVRQVQQRWIAAHGFASAEPDVDRIYEAFLRIDDVKSEQYSKLIPGALETVGALRSRGFGIGSTTGYPRSIMGRIMPLAKAQGYEPDCCVTADDVANGRPRPDMLLAAALALEVCDVRGCVVVDDSPSGLRAARAAGMWAIGICASGNEVGVTLETWSALAPAERTALYEVAAMKLNEAGAHNVIETIADLLPIIDAIDRRLAAGERP